MTITFIYKSVSLFDKMYRKQSPKPWKRLLCFWHNSSILYM